MAEPLETRIISAIEKATWLYYRLVLLVAPPGSGKTEALLKVKESTGYPLYDLNLELSGRLLELPHRQRVLETARLLDEIIHQGEGKAVLLDNTEILFERSLQQDPLRLLQKLSRNKIIVASWNGESVHDQLVYAVPSHPEYRKYPVKDFLIVTPEENNNVPAKKIH